MFGCYEHKTKSVERVLFSLSTLFKCNICIDLTTKIGMVYFAYYSTLRARKRIGSMNFLELGSYFPGFLP